MKLATNIFLFSTSILFSSFCLASTNAELEARVDELNQRVQYLEGQLTNLLGKLENVDLKHADQRASEPDPVPVQKSTTSLSIGGRVKVDMVGNSTSVGGAGGQNRSDISFLPSAIPFPNGDENNQISANARDSRIWLNASTPTDYGELGAYLELDFGSFDNSGNERVSNSHNPRIRHAYATYQNFTVGQTSSTFYNGTSFPEVNDALGPVGILNIRQPLIRYTGGEGRMRWSLAAEQPEATVTASTGQRLVFDDDRVPDLVARMNFSSGQSTISVATILRQLRADDALVEDETTGGGLSFSGRWYLRGADNLRFALTHGEGIGRYVSYNGFNDAVISATGNLEAIPVTSGFVAYQHWWTESWRSNLAIGYASADLDANDYTNTAINGEYLSSHANLLWSPIPSATFGIEWLHGKRKLLNGDSTSLNRLQFTSLYKFKR